MRRIKGILAPLLLLLFSLGLGAIGLYVYNYRHVPRGITDPTGYHVNSLISFMILAPNVIAIPILLGVLIYRLISAFKASPGVTQE